MPKYNLTFICLLAISLQGHAQPGKLKADCLKMNLLNTMITNGSITRQKAADVFKPLLLQIKAESHVTSNSLWVFPLLGYSSKAIGGVKGNGYSDNGYKYLDGNKHSAHPAHDIFINDRNQDNIDDHTKKPVNVVAVTSGVVIACSNVWEPGSTLRGGKYIWLYHPSLNIFTYYAHNQSVLVLPGDVVKQGQKIAEVGRTGLNAYQRRSPTHLHFSAFKLVANMPVPFNCYPNLLKAK